MKKLVVSIMLMFAFVFAGFAQDKADEFGVMLTGTRQDVKLELPNGSDFKLDKSRDSPGFAVDYTHYIANKFVGVTGEFAMSFHSKPVNRVIIIPDGVITENGTSKIALATGMYGVTLKPRNKKVAPYVRGLAGVARQDFGGTRWVNGGHTYGNEWSFAYAGGGGVEFRLNKSVKLRTDLTYIQTRFGDSIQHNGRAGVGLVF